MGQGRRVLAGLLAVGVMAVGPAASAQDNTHVELTGKAFLSNRGRTVRIPVKFRCNPDNARVDLIAGVDQPGPYASFGVRNDIECGGGLQHYSLRFRVAGGDRPRRLKAGRRYPVHANIHVTSRLGWTAWDSTPWRRLRFRRDPRA